MLTRRTFAKLTAAFAALPLTGCGSVKSYITIIIGAVQSILAYVPGPLATQITAALGALEAAVKNWTGGTITQTVVEALNALQAVLDTIPLGATVDALIAIAIAAIDAILNASGGTTVQASIRTVRLHQKPTYIMSTAHAFAVKWNEASDTAGLPASVHVSAGIF